LAEELQLLNSKIFSTEAPWKKKKVPVENAPPVVISKVPFPSIWGPVCSLNLRQNQTYRNDLEACQSPTEHTKRLCSKPNLSTSPTYPLRAAWHILPGSGWVNPKKHKWHKVPILDGKHVSTPDSTFNSIYSFKASWHGLPGSGWVNPRKVHWQRVPVMTNDSIPTSSETGIFWIHQPKLTQKTLERQELL